MNESSRKKSFKRFGAYLVQVGLSVLDDHDLNKVGHLGVNWLLEQVFDFRQAGYDL